VVVRRVVVGWVNGAWCCRMQIESCLSIEVVFVVSDVDEEY
jgi:hypothetical protein